MSSMIKLTKESIDSIIGLFCYESEHGELQGEDKRITEDFIKQILDNQEFRKEMPVLLGERTGYKLRSEALQQENKSMKNKIDYDDILRLKMIKENKQLKEKLEKIQKYFKHSSPCMCENCLDEDLGKILDESNSK